MSVRVLALVWDGFDRGGSELLAMLALADWADDDGRCFPSISSIARKTRLSRSQVQRVVHRLIAAGDVVVTENASGGAPGSSRRYRLALDRLTGRTDATGRVDATGRTDARDGSHGCGETGRAGATLTVIEPSVTITEASPPDKGQGQPEGRTGRAAKQGLPPGFVRFWQAWPASDRKVAKAECAKRWKARGLEAIADTIVVHVELSKRSRQWAAGFEPSPLTYIRQARWSDEVDGPQDRQASVLDDPRFAGAL